MEVGESLSLVKGLGDSGISLVCTLMCGETKDRGGISPILDFN